MSGTGWTWQHVQHHCDLPQYMALCAWWQDVPPAAIQLRRIAQFLGIKQNAQPDTPRMAEPTKPTPPQDTLAAAAMVGLPVFNSKPNDPLLDLI